MQTRLVAGLNAMCNDAFVQHCADVIRDVSKVVRRVQVELA